MSLFKATIITLITFAIPIFLFIPDRAKVLLQSDVHMAEIEGCESKKSMRQYKHGFRRVGWGYAPVALTEDNITAYGTLYLSDKKSCKNQAGQAVKVFVNAKTNEGRINSFLQFWLFPWLIFGAATFMVFTLMRKGRIATLTFLFTGASTTFLWMVEIGKIF